MIRSIAALGIVLVLALPSPARADDLNANVRSSTVLIVSFDSKGKAYARGSGFFVDEGVVISNIHVIDAGGRYYRIFATGKDDAVDLHCYKDLTRSDIKLNLEDDIAYIRVYIDCPHGMVDFASKDPAIGDAIDIFGYPASSGVALTHTLGKVTEETVAGIRGDLRGSWFVTDGVIHGGNSGGPVTQEGKVVGIAVAAHVDDSRTALDGLFIPVSQIIQGLQNANSSALGFTRKLAPIAQPSASQQSSDPFNPAPLGGGSVATSADCRASLGDGGEATGYMKNQGDGCRCRDSYHREGGQCLVGSPESVAKQKERARGKAKSSRSAKKSGTLTNRRTLLRQPCTFDRRGSCTCPTGYRPQATQCLKW
jgi:S1-C subfamily serine protease